MLVRILRFTSELKGYYIAIIICASLMSAAQIAIPFVIGKATDVVVDARADGTDPVGRVILMAVLILALHLANTALKSIGGYFGDVMSVKMKAILSSRYYDKLLRLGQKYFDSELSGKIISRLNRSITEVTNFAGIFSNMFFTTIVTTIAIIVISAIYAWPLAILLVIIFPLYTWLTALTSKKWQVWEKDKNAHIDIAGGRFSEVITQVKVVKSFNQEAREHKIFTNNYREVVSLTGAQSKFWHGMDALRMTALAIIMCAMYALIFVYTVRGQFSVGDMVILIQLITMAAQPVGSMSYIVDSAQRAIAGSADYFSVMELEEVEADTLAPASRPDITGQDLVLDDVHFHYEGGSEVLDGLSFSVGAGEKVALVGESGGGKTTIINLLLGLYRPNSGSIRIGGTDISALSLSELRELSGVVFQEPALFSGTIAENIAYARPDASMEEIVEAAKLANADSFITSFEDGYETLIGERGLKLSGGQKQRISIARAILKDPQILILDEATSALDTKSERLVQEGLESLMAGRTTIIIAHRLSTIASVDRIVTLAGGRVDETGSPAELATSGGIYSQLLALQVEGTKAARKLMKGFDIDR